MGSDAMASQTERLMDSVGSISYTLTAKLDALRAAFAEAGRMNDDLRRKVQAPMSIGGGGQSTGPQASAPISPQNPIPGGGSGGNPPPPVQPTGFTPVGGGGGGGGGGGSGWRAAFGPRLAIRGTVAVLVASAIAEELNNAETYRQAIRMAGMDQGAQSRASAAFKKGAFTGVPIVGGILYNAGQGIAGALGMDTDAAQETDMALADRSSAFQGSRLAAAAEARADRARARAAGAIGGAAGIVAAEAERSTIASGRVASNAKIFQDAEANSYGMGTRPTRFNSGTLSEGETLSQGQARYDRELAIKKQALRDDVAKQERDAEKPAQAKIEAINRTSRFSALMTSAGTIQEREENQYRPARGFGNRQTAEARAELTLFEQSSRGLSDEDISGNRKELSATIMGRIESIETEKRRLVENVMLARPGRFNAQAQSVSAFIDPRIEDTGAALGGLNRSEVILQQILKAVQSFHPQPGTP